MSDTKKILIEGGCDEIVEKKSRFIANVYKIEDYDEAMGYIEQLKKKYWDARHNCYAFVLGENNEVQRYSDDGEPQGTAGKPMLDILLKENVTNCLVVVTRYFGGVLLGTGGLVRAYQQSTKCGLDASIIIEKKSGIRYVVPLDYTTSGKVTYLAQTNGYSIIDTQYMDKVLITLVVEACDVGTFEKKMLELTNGSVEYNKREEVLYGICDDRVIIL